MQHHKNNTKKKSTWLSAFSGYLFFYGAGNDVAHFHWTDVGPKMPCLLTKIIYDRLNPPVRELLQILLLHLSKQLVPHKGPGSMERGHLGKDKQTKDKHGILISLAGRWLVRQSKRYINRYT